MKPVTIPPRLRAQLDTPTLEEHPYDLLPPPGNGSAPNILVYDVETSPILGWGWPPIWDTRVQRIEQDTRMMCFAYQWLGRDKIDWLMWEDGNDENLATALHALLDRADYSVAHNNDRFDDKVANEMFLRHKLGPPSSYKTIDTLKIMRQNFRQSSSKLDDFSKKHLGYGKHKTDFDLWMAFMAGEPAAIRKMERYNRRDVKALRDSYLLLLPWMGRLGKPAGVNYNQFIDDDVCTNCGSKDLVKRGTYRASVYSYQRYQCKNCGKYSRSRHAVQALGNIR